MRQLRDSAGIADITRDMEHLCRAIGTRLAGSPEERAAAEHVATRFRELGLANVELLPFRCRRWLPRGGRLSLLDGPRRQIACQVVTHSPATPPEGVEGELIILEPIQWERGLRVGGLEGKIALCYGGYGESAAAFRELHDSPLRALLFCDTRYVTRWPVANGMGERFMALARKPMAYISFESAWALAAGGTPRVRLVAAGEAVDAESVNVVGELPGDSPEARVIVVSGHLDSVAAGVGADDDAGGVAATLECARRLRTLPRRHTLRFLGFGAEEQLSVGSSRYVGEQLRDLERVAFACNFDSCSARVGLGHVMCSGTPALEDYVRDTVDCRFAYGEAWSGVCPYQDQYPFVARGVPGVWFTRETHPGGYWYHHSVHNTMENCSMESIAFAAETARAMLGDLAARGDWPFPRAVAPDQQAEVARYQRELFAP